MGLPLRQHVLCCFSEIMIGPACAQIYPAGQSMFVLQEVLPLGGEDIGCEPDGETAGDGLTIMYSGGSGCFCVSSSCW